MAPVGAPPPFSMLAPNPTPLEQVLAHAALFMQQQQQQQQTSQPLGGAWPVVPWLAFAAAAAMAGNCGGGSQNSTASGTLPVPPLPAFLPNS
jgi:hypothetical protein